MNISIETIRLKFRNKIYIPLTYRVRRKKLKLSDFTIVSNNCWGGTVYESYGIKKKSPFIGMFIMPDDYLKLVANLDYYLEQPLMFIDPDESKWKCMLEHKTNWKTYLIARLDDIELQMLHYHDTKEALRKWNDRIGRVDRGHLIFKFNDQNGAERRHIQEFADMPIPNKLCFVANKEMHIEGCTILINQRDGDIKGITASREPFGKSKYIDINSYINNLK